MITPCRNCTRFGDEVSDASYSRTAWKKSCKFCSRISQNLKRDLGMTLISDQPRRGRYNEHVHLGGLSPFAFLFMLRIDDCCSYLECQSVQTAQFRLW